MKTKHHNNSYDEMDYDNDDAPSKWYEDLSEDPKEFPPVSEQIKIDLKEEAKNCLEIEIANYNKKNLKGNSNYQWIKTIMSKGTFSDKIASQTIAIQNDPMYSLDILRNFVGMVKVAKKKDCFNVIDTLTELFVENLLKPNCKLKPFEKRPLSLLNDLTSGNAFTRRKLLSAWYFEDQLREIYISFINALHNVAHDTVEANKERAVTAMYKLLVANAEQEKVLLSNIVNKLGDPSQKVASKAIYYLTQLLNQHSNLQGVVLNEVEKLLFRSNISAKTQYYGLCFLSQFYLSHEDSSIARKLIEVYFAFFKACVKKGEVDSRMMSALLMGVNRAYPYAAMEMDQISEHIDTMYRIVHIAPFNVSLHALTLLFQVSSYSNNVTDRFYSALYKKLTDPQLSTTTHQAMFLSLLYKALQKDTEVNRTKAFVKRLLQYCLHLQPNFTCGILYLISQVIEKKESVRSVILKQSTLNIKDDQDDEEKYTDVPSEIDELKIKEEVLSDDESFNNKRDTNVTIINENPIKIEDEEPLDVNKHQPKPSWFHCDNKIKTENGTMENYRYNPFGRNPLYAGVEFSAYVELCDLKSHFHPTVALYAENILNGESIKYSGDPLKDFTLIRFLDRFVFKNPKKQIEPEHSGVHPTFGQRKFYKTKGLKSVPVLSNNYINGDLNAVPVDEKFLHVYLHQKYRDRKISENDDSDVDSVASEEFEEMINKISGVKDDEDADFLNDVKDSIVEKKKKKKVQEEEQSDESSEDEEQSNDDADSFGSAEDEELLDSLSDDDEEDMTFEESTDKKKNIFKGKKIKSLFASAEEFATLLEDEGSSKVAPGKSSTFSNKEGAATKQLQWEEKRNQWLNGYNTALGKKRGRKESGVRNQRNKKLKKS